MAKLKSKNSRLKKEVVPEQPLFGRGFGAMRTRLNKKSRYTMSCYNCHHFYQAPGDKTEVCQNLDVLKFDMVVTETSIFCNRWELVHRAESVDTMFKKRGRK